ncbi:hypothetical protein TH63_09485 [Rufibacter radiotolerans]|uniref:HNH endonuclease n=1 Tax=Rufibacter radiotolerans TaxID=1379910 RepID=A0A0H4VPF0_9BACT|nr:hypothetical protein [Rufibacter radiotolerans]AKQ45822.1 hypothetical protein TH63_09485 [Rufibacter radiotolerans]
MYRTCTKCQQPKLEETEFTNRSSKNNLKRSVCKVCEADYRREKMAPKLKAKREAKEKARLEALASPVKKCTVCLEEKPKSEFNIATKSRDGLSPWCKVCHRRWVEENKATLFYTWKEYREKNKDIIQERKRVYHQTEKSKQQRKDYILRNPEVKKRISNKYARNNRQKVMEISRRSILKNPERYRKTKRDYMRKKIETDPGFAMECRLRSRIIHALRGTGTRKAAKTMELVGCSIEAFKDHVERRFKPGMTWDNRGEWHIDHIVPCASFDLSDSEQQRVCFHYTNLQPLWGKDNIRKKDRIEAPIQMSLPLQLGN